MAVHQAVFPARAGMSPSIRVIEPLPAGFPRTRGDEPALASSMMRLDQFSPHARG